MWAVEPVFAKLAYENSDFLQTSAIRAIIVTLVAILYVLLATTAWATTTIAARKHLRNLDAGVVTMYRYVIASTVFVVYLSLHSSLVFSNIHQILVGFVVGLGTILYYEGLKRLKAAQVSALELATPFFGAIFGFFVLKEQITAMQISGMAALFAGVYLLSRKEAVNC